MRLLAIAVHALVAYGLLLAMMRATGKRTITQSSPFAFVLALILADLVDGVLSAQVGLSQFTVAAGTLVVMDMLLAAAQARSARIQAWVSGEPLPLLRGGRADRAALRKARIREDDLEALLRHHGIERQQWTDVRVAQMETTGGLSVIRTEAAQEVERGPLAAERT